ncbi:MAG: RsmB/NOP family class I SAM-dependent RNA methyltransferase [Eubacterium sp.]|nr:RsmB/NOP family class I SAM-dependent RNA methyltransferase [Eubacterium sp.]
MTDLPEKFLASMREILGDEYESFLTEFKDHRHYGLRVNTSKISKEEFERISPFHLTKIPWVDNGYYYEREDQPAGHPFYAAGLYYLQEPSAMTPASRLSVEPGDRVLDLCAAPGGKATAMAADLEGQGQLVANDINTARARALLRNLELFGISNSFVTNEPPYVLAEKFPEYFDKIMVDAPCSGEGMFRKNPAVVDAWLEKGPEYFSSLQKEIVLYAADMLRAGGRMFYSTCTFSPLENEAVISWLLEKRPGMKVIPMEDYAGFSPGISSFEGMDFHPDCRLTRRIWPHHMEGEGHFLALLEKEGEDEEGQEDTFREKTAKKAAKKQGKGKSGKNRNPKPDKEQKRILDELFTLLKEPFTSWINPDSIEIRGDKVYYVPEKHYENKGIHFLRNGVYLGDLKKNRFEPSQPFALVLTGESFSNCLNFRQDDERLDAYLRGETLLIDDFADSRSQRQDGKNLKNGWVLILVEGYPIGFGKRSGNLVKNKYPAGWRRR